MWGSAERHGKGQSVRERNWTAGLCLPTSLTTALCAYGCVVCVCARACVDAVRTDETNTEPTRNRISTTLTRTGTRSLCVNWKNVRRSQSTAKMPHTTHAHTHSECTSAFTQAHTQWHVKWNNTRSYVCDQCAYKYYVICTQPETVRS